MREGGDGWPMTRMGRGGVRRAWRAGEGTWSVCLNAPVVGFGFLCLGD